MHLRPGEYNNPDVMMFESDMGHQNGEVSHHVFPPVDALVADTPAR